MKANEKTTALQVLIEAGVPKAKASFGKMRIIVGGIPGIVDPEHPIRVMGSELEVIVGAKKYTLKLE